MMTVRSHISVLEQLRLPARYERLVERVGPDVAAILVPPSKSTMDELAKLVDAVRTQDEGLLVPLSGKPGAGKTTFASTVTQWAPSSFAPSVIYDGVIAYDALVEKVRSIRSLLPANDRRTIPVVVDHREAAPPTNEEMSVIKRFVRSTDAGSPSVVFWPETDPAIAQSMSDRFVEIAGHQPIKLPLHIDGPDRQTWVEVAKDTLRLSNDIESLDELGVNPSDYDVTEFNTIGDFLRRLSTDFNLLLSDLRKSVTKDLELLVLFASESSTPGVLSQLVNASRYGLLDGTALLSATPDSVVGRWWSSKRGLLTRTIVQLNARALCLPPVASISALRNCGPANDPIFEALGVPRVGSSRAVRDLERSDVGKVLKGEKLSKFEARGTPASESLAAFQLLAETGLGAGRDKRLNAILGNAFGDLLTKNRIDFIQVTNETSLAFAPLIPDTKIEFQDFILCIEYAWRSGDFLQSKRSVVAAYILTKLQNYARELGWTQD
jgi:hypothetical protein